MKLVFWAFIFLLVWEYFGYPLILFVLVSIKEKKRKSIIGGYSPKISIIIAAHNEEKEIRERIENCLSLNYPLKKMEIIIASDGSTDKTVEIAGKGSQKRNSCFY